ncbi:MAG: helix-turn-helix domain-containing protein [Proteobacteria bacterium]|nr:helix-turn-helix domain-containing protein [Pseudomonadota bacterium]
MTSLQRTKNSYSEPKLYNSMGSLIKDYRHWRRISQEKISSLVGVSVRQLQNWEAGCRRARIENLHDLAEATGIPMQVFVALNADQPLWYSMQKRHFAYSSLEAHCVHHELFRYPNKSSNEIILKSECISTNKHISIILSCHSDLYCMPESLQADVIKKASMILPDLNRITFDSWGHYVGHSIWLPLKTNDYKQLRQLNSIENHLTPDRICDIIALDEGTFFNYSSYSASLNMAHCQIMNVGRNLAEIKHKSKYLIAANSFTEEVHELLSNMDMKVFRSYESVNSEVCNKLYEVKLDLLMRPKGPWQWLVEEVAKSRKKLSKISVIKE